MSHSQIVYNQCQVLVDSVEELELLSHLVGLFVQFLDLKLTWSDVSFELLNLVVKHELELLQLLSFLSKVVDSLVLVIDRCCSLLQLTFLRFNCLLQVISQLVELVKLSLFLLDFPLLCLFVRLL